MTREVEHMLAPFERRVDAGRVWSTVAFRMPRIGLSVLLAAIPAALVALAAVLGPPELARAVTDAENVKDTFANFVDAIATASAIAVSVAVLAIRREMKGVRGQRERHEESDAYRERVRQASGLQRAPLGLGPFLAVAVTNARDAARQARREGEHALGLRVGDVTLGSYLDAIEVSAQRVARRLDAAGPDPGRVAAAALDFEEEMTLHLLRNFRRAEGLGERLELRLAELEEAVESIVLGAKYAKTLDLQWGFSRMSLGIALATLPAIVVAAFMTLAYGEGAVGTLGQAGAGLLVAGAFAVVLLPVGIFVSYILRFVFLNEHTLPVDSFVLGPEAPDVVERPGSRGARRPSG